MDEIGGWTGDRIDRAAQIIARAKHAVVFTGAGISAESGIPTFRGKGGLWEKYDPEEVASISGFMRNPRAFWEFSKDLLVKVKAEPNDAHRAIAELEKMGIVKAVITQNVDMLHQRAGSRKVLELHGSMSYVDCLKCGAVYVWEDIEKIIDNPVCQKCGSELLKPRVVFFGEPLPSGILSEAMEEARKCDVFIAIGTSLVVYPAAHLPFIAKDHGAKLILINAEPTDKDYLFDVVIHDKAAPTMRKILERVKEIRGRD